MQLLFCVWAKGREGKGKGQIKVLRWTCDSVVRPLSLRMEAVGEDGCGARESHSISDLSPHNSYGSVPCSSTEHEMLQLHPSPCEPGLRGVLDSWTLGGVSSLVDRSALFSQTQSTRDVDLPQSGHPWSWQERLC